MLMQNKLVYKQERRDKAFSQKSRNNMNKRDGKRDEERKICAMQCLMAEDMARLQEVLPHDRTDIRVAILHEILAM
jgi:hypothetical protein